jgi:hypothetical protein
MNPVRVQHIGTQKKLMLVEYSTPGAAVELTRLGKNLRYSKFKEVFVERKKSPFAMWYERRMVHFKLEQEKSGTKVKRTGSGLLIGETTAEGLETESAADTGQVFVHATEFAGNSVTIRGVEYKVEDPCWERSNRSKSDNPAPMIESSGSSLKRKPPESAAGTSPGAQVTTKRNKDETSAVISECVK